MNRLRLLLTLLCGGHEAFLASIEKNLGPHCARSDLAAASIRESFAEEADYLNALYPRRATPNPRAARAA